MSEDELGLSPIGEPPCRRDVSSQYEPEVKMSAFEGLREADQIPKPVDDLHLLEQRRLHWDFDLPSGLFPLPLIDERQRRNTLGETARRVLNL
jgi:hypothetical protein